MRASRPPISCRRGFLGYRLYFSKAPAQKGFSLVEVMLALGVMSFAMTGLIGLLSVGLGLSRNFMNITSETQVVQTVSNELQLMDYSAVVGGSATYTGTFPRFYDEGGVFIKTSAGNTPANAFFKVNLQQQSYSLSGSAVDEDIAKTVIFEVVNLHGNLEKKTYSALAVNNGL
ncbi:MAG: prepilin-type N-terminal cleavage/methylation domain-containing protein [Chthoniobacteraceae bacterium]